MGQIRSAGHDALAIIVEEYKVCGGREGEWGRERRNRGWEGGRMEEDGERGEKGKEKGGGEGKEEGGRIRGRRERS